MSLLRRASWRYLQRHPWQMTLAVLGVALGVAVVVAVDLANESARRGFELSVADVSGRTTHQIFGGPAGLDERLYTELRQKLADYPSAPVVEAYGTVAGETVHLLGVDPFSEARFRDHLDGAGQAGVSQLLTNPQAALLPAATAKRIGLRTGDRFTLSVDGYHHPLELVDLIESQTGAAAIDGLLLVDIATAQELAGQVGRLSRIELKLPGGAGGALAETRLRAWLPPAAELVRAGTRAATMQHMTRAFRTNLTAMSLLALVVGMFLIHNTMTFAVLQRRSLLGTLRLLGVTRGGVFRVVLGEAAWVGLVGTGLGLLGGLALGQGLVGLVTRTINDHYFVLTVSDYLVTALPLLKGVLLGLGATLLSALLPALEAATTSPHAALHRSQLESRARRLAPQLALAGLSMCALAMLVLVYPSRAIGAGFVALFLLIVGLALVSPVVVALLSGLVSPVLGRLFGVQARLAVRGVAAGLSRTGIAIAALMLAVATVVGVGVMVQSFRATVNVWLQSTLRADIYVAVPGVRSAEVRGTLDPSLLASVKKIAGVAHYSTGRRVMVQSAAVSIEVLALGLSSQLTPRYPLKAGDPALVWDAFRAGEAVLVSEPLAWHRKLAVGDTLTLRTDAGPQRFTIAGIYYDYGTEHGQVLMPRSLYDRYFEDRGISALGLYLEPGVDPDQVIMDVRRLVAAQSKGQEVLVRGTQEIREMSLAIFDRTFTITQVLRLLAVVVAFVGILSAFMALQLERAKELATLRAIGLTPLQVGGLVTLQTTFMGLVAGLLAIPTGLVLAEVLIHVINRRSFGWSMQTLVEPQVLIEALLLALSAAALAGLYPGWKMAHTSPAVALREE